MSLKESIATIHELTFEFNEEVIARVKGLSTKGKRWFEHRTNSSQQFNLFTHRGETMAITK